MTQGTRQCQAVPKGVCVLQAIVVVSRCRVLLEIATGDRHDPSAPRAAGHPEGGFGAKVQGRPRGGDSDGGGQGEACDIRIRVVNMKSAGPFAFHEGVSPHKTQQIRTCTAST